MHFPPGESIHPTRVFLCGRKGRRGGKSVRLSSWLFVVPAARGSARARRDCGAAGAAGRTGERGHAGAAGLFQRYV